MLVGGVDFTCAPSRRKPITRADCRLVQGVLLLERIRPIPGFEAFEAMLAEFGPWIVGFDFPFGQSRRFVEGVGWPIDWQRCAEIAGALTRPAFVEVLEDYKRNRPVGDKEHRRVTDQRARSISPQKLYGVPVARMYHAGVPRIAAARVSIPPCRPTGDNRVVLEAYPALVARRFVGRAGYKSDERAKQSPAHRIAREAIVAGLASALFRDAYGFTVALEPDAAEDLVADATGDRLDALLCAVQAAWALGRPDFGIPADCDPLEGWIVDPSLAPCP